MAKRRSVRKSDKKPMNYHGFAFDKGMLKDKRRPKWLRQIKERGFDDTETWSLDAVIAAFALPRLKRFREINNGFPCDTTDDEWNKTLDKMILAFEYMGDENISYLPNEEQTKAMAEGIELFGKHFRSLWW